MSWLVVLAMLAGGCSDSGNGTPDAYVQDGDGAPNDPGPLDDAGMDGGDVGADTDVDAGGDIAGGDEGPAGLVTLADLTYLGAFRLSSAEHGISSTNYAICTLGYNPANHSLFIAGHDHHRAVAEFAIPEPGTADDVTLLPVVEAPLQVFAPVLDQGPHGNPEELDRITGLLWVEGRLLINAETWYDAPGDNVDTTLVVRDAADLTGDIDGYFELTGAARAAGYMAPVPEAWQAPLGGTHLAGWSSVYSIISRYSVGPSLWIFDPVDITSTAAGAQGPVAATPLMNFDYGAGHYLAPDALDAQEGSASDLWNFLSRGVYGFIVPGTRTFAVFGSSGGVDSGIGYKITQDDGNLCGGYCSYAADDNYNYYWFFDLDEILAADEVYEPRPYEYGRWSVPFDDGGAHEIRGGAFDPASRRLYLALEGAGQVGDYDYTPLIVVFGI
jgi:hypothetical protein